MPLRSGTSLEVAGRVFRAWTPIIIASPFVYHFLWTRDRKKKTTEYFSHMRPGELSQDMVMRSRKYRETLKSYLLENVLQEIPDAQKMQDDDKGRSAILARIAAMREQINARKEAITAKPEVNVDELDAAIEKIRAFIANPRASRPSNAAHEQELMLLHAITDRQRQTFAARTTGRDWAYEARESPWTWLNKIKPQLDLPADDWKSVQQARGTLEKLKNDRAARASKKEQKGSAKRSSSRGRSRRFAKLAQDPARFAEAYGAAMERRLKRVEAVLEKTDQMQLALRGHVLEKIDAKRKQQVERWQNIDVEAAKFYEANLAPKLAAAGK